MAPLFVSVFVLSCVASLGLTRAAIRLAYRLRAVDWPGHRKIHSRPVAYLGGLGLLAGALVALAVVSAIDPSPRSALELDSVKACLLPVFVVSLMGLWDDLRDVSVPLKSGIQLLAALAFSAFAFRFEKLHFPGLQPWSLGPLAIPVTAFFILSVINGFNMIDGSDGLCAGASMACLALIALAAGITEQPQIVLVALAFAGAAFGFLFWNRPPAQVYLGDAGSQALGMLCACLVVALGARPLGGAGGPTQPFHYQVPIALLLVIYPALEVALTVARRGLQGRSLVRGDQGHLHHRLWHLGVRPWGIVALAVLLSGLGGSAAVVILLRAKGLATVLLLLLAGLLGFSLQALGFTRFLRLNWLEEGRPQFALLSHFAAMQRVKLGLAQKPQEVYTLLGQACQELGVQHCRVQAGPAQHPAWSWARPRKGSDSPVRGKLERLKLPMPRLHAEWQFAAADPSVDRELALETKVIMAELMKRSLERLRALGIDVSPRHADPAEGMQVHALGRRLQAPKGTHEP